MKIVAPADFLFISHTGGILLSIPRENGHVISCVMGASADLAGALYFFPAYNHPADGHRSPHSPIVIHIPRDHGVYREEHGYAEQCCREGTRRSRAAG